MRAREFIREYEQPKHSVTANTPEAWSRSENRNIIDMILNSVVEHPGAWRDAATIARSAPGFSENFNSAFGKVIDIVHKHRRLEYCETVMRNILFGGESDSESSGGIKKLALGGALAALIWDSNNVRDEYPKTAGVVFVIPKNNVLRQASRGDELCALLLTARLVYDRIKSIEDDHLQQRADGATPSSTVDGRLDRELDGSRNVRQEKPRHPHALPGDNSAQ